MTPAVECREVSFEAWDGLVDRAEFGTVYHRNGWLRALERELGLRFHRLELAIEGRTAAIWPVATSRKGPLRIAGSPLPGWNTAYLGPLFVDPAARGPESIEAMIRAAPLRSPIFMAFRLMDAGIAFSDARFRRTRDFVTYEMDLNLPESRLWSDLKGTCRTRIRKGEKNGLVIREESGPAYLEDFWPMARDVFAKSNQEPPYSLNFLRVIDDELRPRGELIVTSAWLDGTRVATLIVPHDGHAAMYFAGGTRADAVAMAPSNLLHWRTILLCKERGMHRYDFISNRGSPGKFKSTFSPLERVSCVHWERAAFPVVWRLRDHYERRARRARKLER
jgi:hypothetical protein